MRVAILTTWFPSNKRPLYGIFVQTQAISLSDECDVTVLLLRRSFNPYIKKYKKGNLNIIEKGTFYLPNSLEYLLKKWAKKYADFFLEVHNENPFDIIHCHDHFGSYAGYSISEKINIPYITTIHNTNILNGSLVSWKKSYLNRILSKASKVLAVGPKLAAVLSRDYKLDNVTIIPNFIDTNRFSLSQRRNAPFKFLFVGDLEKRKGIDLMIKALKHIEDAELHIVGNGVAKKDLLNLAENKQVSNRVYFHGAVLNEEVVEYYHLCHIYLSLSHVETFGVTVIEAMSCGMPVIYTESGGPENIVGEHGAISVKPNVESVVFGMQKMMKDYPSLDPQKIRAHVLKHYSPSVVIKELMTLYKNIVH